MEKAKRRHRATGRTVSEGMKAHHASKTDEQAAAHRAATSEGMRRWHANRTEAEREQSRQKQTDAAVANVFTTHQPGFKFTKGRSMNNNNTPEAIERRALTRVRATSVKRILKDLVDVQPELIRDALVAGLQAAPPRSFPYLALAFSYLEGRPPDAKPSDDTRPDLADLTADELVARMTVAAQRIKEAELARDAARPRVGTLPVIDITPQEDK
jgi:hypothetical protein